MTDTSRFVGIDISKSSFEICILPERQSARFANTAEGIAAFIAFVAPMGGIERLILKPTGGYERRVAGALQSAGLPVVRINAKQIRSCRKRTVARSATIRRGIGSSSFCLTSAKRLSMQ